MAATQNDLIMWFRLGVAQGKARMIVWCDTYDYEDYAVYSDLTGNDLKVWTRMEDGKNMKRLMEVYDLTGDMDAQMSVNRAFNY